VLSEEKVWRDERDPAIVIKPVAGRTGEYLVYCKSGFPDATFSVYFKDTLMGALAGEGEKKKAVG